MSRLDDLYKAIETMRREHLSTADLESKVSLADIIDWQNKHADTSLVTILGDSMELVEGRQPIAGAWGIPPCCPHPICLHAKSAPHRVGMQPDHAALFGFKAWCHALRAGEAFGFEQRLTINRESLQIEAGKALPHFFHFRCHPFHLFTF